MDLTLVSLIVFVSIAAVTTAVVMVLRDIFVPATARSSLRRQYTVADEAPARGLAGSIDQSFDRLILEAGWESSSLSAFSTMLAAGLSVGSVLFLIDENPLTAILGCAIGIGVVLTYFLIRRTVRLTEIRNGLPDLVDLMSRAVRAGESLDQAIQLVGRETSGALGYEFRQCGRQLEMGMSVAAVMKSLLRRHRLIEMRILATTLMVHRQTGGNLALTLERMAGVIRERLNYHRQMQATTGAGRLSAMLIGIAGPAMFLGMFFWQFEYLKLMLDESIGQVAIGVALVLEVVGLVWVYSLLKTE